MAVVAILLAWGLYLFSKNIFALPWWIEAPSVIGFYGILHRWFEKKLWRNKYIRKFFRIKTPIIDGDWSGSITSHSTHANGQIPIKKFCIKQTWTHVVIYLETETSESYSFEASMNVDEFGTARIHYQYMNKPKDNAPETMHVHYGSASAKLDDQGILQTEYYSGRDRNNTGSFTVERE
ncbi:MAG: hypothetical protein V4721_06550 [Bacteroidota bacterium]